MSPNKILLLLFLSTFMSSCFKPKPKQLMVDLLSVPEESVITNPNPHFSWVIDDQGKGARQTAWHIMLASSLEKLSSNDPDMWNSGMIMSDQSVSVPYNGNELQPAGTYWWKVRTWDQNGRPGMWSKSQRFNTGEFNPEGLEWPGESRWVKRDNGSSPEYVPENRHAIRYHDIAPVSVVKNSEGNHFISFEKAAFATLKFRLEGAGDEDTLIIHLGEKSTDMQQVDKQPGGSISYRKVVMVLKKGVSDYMVELPRQRSRYPNSQVLAEHMPEVASFRYAEIEGWNGDIKPTQVRQYALLYRFDDKASDFKSSDNNFNQIWDLCKHTLKVTPFMGIYLDGTRERMPYEADAYIQQICHYCVDREFAIQRYSTAFLIFNPSWPTEWHLHIVLMAWADYMATGDTRMLEKYYDELRKKTLLSLAREDGLISTRTGLVTEEFLKSIHYHGTSFRDIVDWPQGTPANEEVSKSGFGSVRIEGETDRYIFSDINTVVNAFHYRNLVLMTDIAGILGKTEDEAFFRGRSVLVKKSFNEKLFDKNTGLYLDGEGVNHSSLHANMFPVAFGLASPESYPRLGDFLKSKGMACSPYGAPYLFDALYETGETEYAIELLRSESDRSWMNMIRFGTTITSEAWDIKFKRNLGWNHAWGASPVYIITRKIFGIEPLEPGFKKILIKPQPGKLRHARIKSPVIMGTVYAEFDNNPESNFQMELIIPANTSAKLMLPCPPQKNCTVKINGKITEFVKKGNFMVIDNVEAGKYDISVEW